MRPSYLEPQQQQQQQGGQIQSSSTTAAQQQQRQQLLVPINSPSRADCTIPVTNRHHQSTVTPSTELFRNTGFCRRVLHLNDAIPDRCPFFLRSHPQWQQPQLVPRSSSSTNKQSYHRFVHSTLVRLHSYTAES